MFAGKSTELLRRVKRFQLADKKVLCIKYIHDNRYSNDNIVTHDSESMTAKVCARLEEVEDIIDGFDCIGIDEGQFVNF